MKRPITSHRHGHGRLARQAWGSKESCTVCMAEEAQMQKVRRCGCGELLMRGQDQCDACSKVHSPQIERDDGGFCCSECYAVSTDDYRGFAIPDGCKDEECDCHIVERQPERRKVKSMALHHALTCLAMFAFGAAFMMLWLIKPAEIVDAAFNFWGMK